MAAQQSDASLPWVQFPITQDGLAHIQQQNSHKDWKNAGGIQSKGWKVDHLTSDLNISKGLRTELLHHIKMLLQRPPFEDSQWPKDSKNNDKKVLFHQHFSGLRNVWAQALGIDPDSKRFQDQLYEAVKYQILQFAKSADKQNRSSQQEAESSTASPATKSRKKRTALDRLEAVSSMAESDNESLTSPTLIRQVRKKHVHGMAENASRVRDLTSIIAPSASNTPTLVNLRSLDNLSRGSESNEIMRTIRLEYNIEEKNAQFCFWLNRDVKILRRLNQLQKESIQPIQPSFSNIDNDKVRETIATLLGDKNAQYQLSLNLEGTPFHETLVDEFNDIENLAHMAWTFRVAVISFRIQVKHSPQPNVLDIPSDQNMTIRLPESVDIEMSEPPPGALESSQVQAPEPSHVQASEPSQVQAPEPSEVEIPVIEDVLPETQVLDEQDEGDFHPSRPRYDMDGNFLPENDEQTQLEAQTFAEEEATRQMSVTQRILNPEERAHEVAQLKSAALQSCEPDSVGEQFPFSQQIVDELQQQAEEDIRQQLDKQADDIAYEAQFGAQNAEQQMGELLDIQARCAHQSTDQWAEACAFFRRHNIHDLSDFTWLHLKRSLKAYQVLAVFTLLKFNVSLRGGFLGDEQGLGKTAISLSFASILAILEAMWLDYTQNPTNHLQGEKAEKAGKSCHFAQKVQLPFTCICENGFPIWLKRAMRHRSFRKGLQLFIVPSSVVKSWADEFIKMFRPPKDTNFKFNLFVAHSTVKLPSGLSHVSKLAPNLAHWLRTQTAQPTDGEVGQTFSFALTTPQSFRSAFNNVLQGITDRVMAKTSTWSGSWKVVSTKIRYNYQVATVFVDECHKHRGATSEFADILGQRFAYQPLRYSSLFLLSGTTWEKGPDDLKIYVQIFQKKWKLFEDDQTWLPSTFLKARTVFTSDNIKDIQSKITAASKSHLYSQGDGSDITARDQHRRLIRDIADNLADLFECVMIRRTSQTPWLDGKSLLPLPPLTEERVECIIPKGSKVETLLLQLASQDTTTLRKEITTQAMSNKAKGKKNAPNLNQQMLSRFTSNRPVVTFPFLYNLLQGVQDANGQIVAQISDFTATNLEKAHQIFSNPGNNILRRCAKQLVKTSFKFKRAYDEIKKQLGTVENKWDIRLGQQTADASRSGKVVILTSKPVVAAAFYECLRHMFETDSVWETNPKRPTVSCYYSQMSMKKRDGTISAFQEDPMIDEDGNPVVLLPDQVSMTEYPDVIIGTIETLGIGVTLHRATLVIILEPQFMESFTAQAKKRIHRLGQHYACRSLVLHTDALQSERLIAHRGEFRKMFSEAVAAADNSVGDEDDAEYDEA